MSQQGTSDSCEDEFAPVLLHEAIKLGWQLDS